MEEAPVSLGVIASRSRSGRTGARVTIPKMWTYCLHFNRLRPSAETTHRAWCRNRRSSDSV